MAGAVFRVFVVGAVFHACKTEQNSREIFFNPLLKRWLDLRNKSVYDPNFALFFAISTLIFCSLCLLFFVFFSFLFFLLGDYLIKIDDIFCKISSIQSPLRYLDIPYSVLHSPLS